MLQTGKGGRVRVPAPAGTGAGFALAPGCFLSYQTEFHNVDALANGNTVHISSVPAPLAP